MGARLSDLEFPEKKMDLPHRYLGGVDQMMCHPIKSWVVNNYLEENQKIGEGKQC